MIYKLNFQILPICILVGGLASAIVYFLWCLLGDYPDTRGLNYINVVAVFVSAWCITWKASTVIRSHDLELEVIVASLFISNAFLFTPIFSESLIVTLILGAAAVTWFTKSRQLTTTYKVSAYLWIPLGLLWPELLVKLWLYVADYLDRFAGSLRWNEFHF
jgi:hypothetical protein